MSKLNSQKSVKKTEEVPEIEEPKKKKVEIIEEVPEIEEEDDDEDENGEVPEPVKEVKEIPKEDINKIQQQRAEEIQILQNDGIYRVENLFVKQNILKELETLNKNLEDFIDFLKN